MTCRSPNRVEWWHFLDCYIEGNDGRVCMDMVNVEGVEEITSVNVIGKNPGLVREESELEFTSSVFTVGGYHGNSAAAIYLALRGFKDLPFAAAERVVIPRPERRRMERENAHVPLVRIVQLRQTEPSGMHRQSKWHLHNRHIRSGTWRRLPEPLKHDSRISGGKIGDEVVWVRPAVVGPQGAPLLQPRESIYVVAR